MKMLPLVLTLILAPLAAQAWSGADRVLSDSPSYTQPREQCVVCRGEDKGWNGLDCCPADFAQNCEKNGGVARKTDLHPVYTWALACYRQAPDQGFACATDAQCLSGACDLKSAVGEGSDGACRLYWKRIIDTRRDLYDAIHLCDTERPGRCLPAPADRLNPGGVIHQFRMEGLKLHESRRAGPIH